MYSGPFQAYSIVVLGGLPLGAVGGSLENAQKVSRRHPSENAVVRVQIWYTIGHFSARCAQGALPVEWSGPR